MSRERNYGIDLVKVVAAGYVILMHSFNIGGVVNNTSGIGFALAWWINLLAYSAVDIFAVVTGFCSYSENTKPIKFTRCLTLWAEFVFYSIIILIIAILFFPSIVNASVIFNTFFPVGSHASWYLKAYIGMMLMKPIMDRAVCQMQRKTAMKYALILLAVFSVFNMVVGAFNDGFWLDSGFNFTWLSMCYLFGAIVKKSGLHTKITLKKCFGGILLITTLAWAVNMSMALLTHKLLGRVTGMYVLATYNSINVILIAILHVIGFSKIIVKGSWKRVVAYASRSTFAVYVLNTNWLVYHYFMKGRFAYLGGKAFYRVLTDPLLFSVLFVCSAVLLDQIRIKVFSVLKINQKAEAVCNTLNRWLDLAIEKADIWLSHNRLEG